MFSICKILIILILLFAIMTITVSEWERNKLKIFKYIIESPKLKSEHKFVYISDLHEKEFGKDNEELLKKIDELAPDFILVGGDLIRCHKVHEHRKYKDRDGVRVGLELLEKLGSKYKVYFSYGNHEQRLLEKAGLGDCKDTVKYDKYIQDISKGRAEALKKALCKAELLENTTLSFDDFDITGITLPLKYYRPLLFKKREELVEEDIEKLVGSPSPDKFHIMLMHTPMYYREAIRHGEDLVISGHYHGGTVNLPFFGALMTPQFQFLVKECAGEYKYQDGTLIVSRGLGTHSVNIRINDRPEISFITIKPKEDIYA